MSTLVFIGSYMGALLYGALTHAFLKWAGVRNGAELVAAYIFSYGTSALLLYIIVEGTK